MALLAIAPPVAWSPLRRSNRPSRVLPGPAPSSSRLSLPARCLAASLEPPEGERGTSAGEGGSSVGGGTSARWGVRPALAGQVAIAVGTAGFVDAGYSGDWSRIGAITAETEQLLQLAAWGVVPLAAAAIFLLQTRQDKQE